MSSEYDSLISDGAKIQMPEEPMEKSSQASTSNALLTFKEFIGKVTEDKELLAKLENVINVKSGSANEVKIQKVSEVMLRDDCFKKYFKPGELSTGPIHAADPNLFKVELKLKLAKNLIERRKISRELLLRNIKNEIKDIKMQFDKEALKSYTDDEQHLIWLLFLDGCAMLEFIYSYVKGELKKYDISNGQAALIQRDLFLLENQIPFRVLEVLVGSPFSSWLKKENPEDEFFKFILTSSITTFSSNIKDLEKLINEEKKKPVHILDFLRYVITADVPDHGINCLLAIMLLPMLLCSCGIFLLLICMMCCSSASKDPSNWSKKQSFRNVQELKAAGIAFKPIHSLKGISFHTRFSITGWLKLPTMMVDNSTKRMLLNLVAFEMCLSDSHPEKDPWVTSYINLLDLLIDNEQDVKDLRAVDILRNCLSSDDDVAQLINSIGSYCFAPPESNDTYKNVKDRIENHYRRKCAIWIAQVYYAHFSSPLAILALFVATVLLGLTIVQTVYTINPK